MAVELLLMAGSVGGAGDQERSRRRAVRRRIRETVALRRACAAAGADARDAAGPRPEVAGSHLP
ncbi:hypothetical protein I0C86_18160 [Plantactinospora sp. S1510]|uniref:Uncharacterized protein n=1 Tax=Plantactinospora alkalitolerans TaxID=2789879 RepID=A0ABS0GXC8_9ACTN|nr:hypothetical protein [Plantactinospora alkalitolerans]MBF9130867.1 hypothetical protein [Plantactinospora alkalitolerans]